MLFLLKKWNVIIELQEQGYPNTKNKLENIKKEAMTRNHWETLRECDLYQALATKDLNLLTHLYYGTPYSGYKNRILSSAPTEFKISDYYNYGYLQNDNKKNIFNLEFGESLDKKTILSPGTVLHKGLVILCEDFYKPLSLGVFFSKIYPDEYFNPISSPGKIFKLVDRLRKWFKKNNLALDIHTKNTQFKLINNQGFIIKIPKTIKDINKNTILIQKLKDHFKHKSFSTSQAQLILKTSAASAFRLLKFALESGQVIKSGKGRSVLYRFED